MGIKGISNKKSRWLITGGCGFIGTRLIKHLLAENTHPKIRVLDNLTAGSKNDLSAVCEYKEIDLSELKFSSPIGNRNENTVELVIGDIKDYKLCLESCSDIDVVVHLAANTGVAPSVENPKEDMESNVLGTFNMLESSRRKGVKRFVFASSGAPIGECSPPIHEELAPHPVSPYGASKLAGEGYCSAYYRTFGLDTVSLRFGNVYGPGSGKKSSVVAKFIRLAVEGETLEIYGDGKQTRDFIFIGDLVKAIRLAAEVENIGGEIFQIASNSETTIGELVETLLPILAKSGYKNINITNTASRIGDVRRNFSDTTKAKKRLGWYPMVELRQGLELTMKWFLQKKNYKR